MEPCVFGDVGGSYDLSGGSRPQWHLIISSAALSSGQRVQLKMFGLRHNILRYVEMKGLLLHGDHNDNHSRSALAPHQGLQGPTPAGLS